ncbi:hypothetical protein BRC97_11505 [Halobacteriales archaeon QS_6_71_20]|nr:MAG: hypothetical protein BRC97_11505 [Halobacteriales archaeon QS_6_71_20]
MNTGRLAGAAADAVRPAGVGLAAALGGGLLYVPDGVAQGAGPQAPLSYLLAGVGAACLAAAFAVVASGPFDERGPVYGPTARVWGSRTLGALAAWAALAGYVALLGLLAEWLGRLAPLPTTARAYVEGTAGGPSGPAALLGVAPPGDVAADALAVAVCVLALGAHLLGRRRATLAAAVPAWGVVVGVGALLSAAFVPGVGEFVAGNFDPLYPTSGLRAAPVRSLAGGVAAALFAFVGVEAAAYAAAGADDGDAADESGATTERDGAADSGTTTAVGAPRPGDAAPVVAAAVIAAVVTLAALVGLGVVDWVRLNLADVPAADAVGAYLPVDPVAVTVVVSVVAGPVALVALGVPAAGTLVGLTELCPPLARGPDEPPVVPLVVVYGAAAGLAVGDLAARALYVAVPGLALSYLAVAASVAAMPSRRPDLWSACRWRPTGLLLAPTLGGAVAAAATLSGLALTSDPATTLGLTLHRVALAVFEFELVSDPLGGVVPAILAWELVGVGLLVVLRDYHETTGVKLAPLDGPPADPSAEGDDESARDGSVEGGDEYADDPAPEP